MIDELGNPVTYESIVQQALAFIFVLEQAGVKGGGAVVVVGSVSRCDLTRVHLLQTLFSASVHSCTSLHLHAHHCCRWTLTIQMSLLYMGVAICPVDDKTPTEFVKEV
jgi:hypothetical protein